MRIWLLIAVVVLAGCTDDGGDDAPSHDDECADAADHQACHEALVDGDDAPNDADSGNDTSVDPEPRAAVTWDIDVGDNSFDAGSLSIQVGDTVRWTQSGSNPHTVTEDDGAFDSHADCDPLAPLDPLGTCMGNGDTFEHTFETVGDVGYYCKVHGGPGSGMSGTISVLERLDDTP